MTNEVTPDYCKDCGELTGSESNTDEVIYQCFDCFKKKQEKAKTFETVGVFRQLAQMDRGKNKKHPFTKFVIETPYIEQKRFSELCTNDGYKLSIKIEYLPYTKKTSKEKRKDE